jgi:hypothetical protein
MDLVNQAIARGLLLYQSIFGEGHELPGLTVLSMVAGVVMLWVFGKTSNQAAIRAAKNRIHASLYVLRLYDDDAKVLWEAQKSLVRSNGIYMLHMMRPLLLAILPMMALLLHMDAIYGRSPLPLGESATLTIQLAPAEPVAAVTPQLEMPAGFVVETPGVRVEAENQVSWRVRAVREGSGTIRIAGGGGTLHKQIDAGGGIRHLSERSAASLYGRFMHPGEPRIQAAGVEYVELRYPSRYLKVAGIEMHWLVWFFVVSSATALLLRNRLGVAI